MKNSISCVLILLFLASCERVIDLDLRDDAGKFVIEGNITDQTGAQNIRLSTNVPFSDQTSSPPVSGAQINITDDKGNRYIFTEGPAGTYTAQSLAGIYGRSYAMTVAIGDKIFSATSKMPSLVKLDSVTTRKDKFEDDEDTRLIAVHYQDPIGTPNQYRFIVYVNGALIKRIFVNNDQYSDGRPVTFDLQLDDDDDPKVYPGDTVKVEMQCIDEKVYTYWYSLSSQQGVEGPGGSVTPADPPTNIWPASLGYFSAHTTESKTIIVR
jgi:hypothetical protein